MLKKVYTIKKGYSDIAQFETLEEAIKFFADIVRGNARNLFSIGNDKKGKAYYWGNKSEFGLEIEEFDIYPTKKDAEYSIFSGEEE